MSMTVAEYRALAKKRNKYRAKPQKSGAIRFGSKREKARYGELLWLEKAGEIAGLEVHPTFSLDVNEYHIGFYTGDFGYQTPGGYVLEDAKGGKATRTEAYGLRKRLMKAIHGVEVREV